MDALCAYAKQFSGLDEEKIEKMAEDENLEQKQKARMFENCIE